MSDLDEGRDLRAAFGTLLADEPASPWSAADDVARGRALQRRRRTRAGAGIGLVAAAVMVFGIFGPLRPPPTAVVPPAYQPPAVQGVDQAWLEELSTSITWASTAAVDWSRSTITPTAGGGFALDLTLVAATLHLGGGKESSIEYAEPPGPAVARTSVTWKPAGGEGPVLDSCAAPACVRSERGISPGFAEEGGRWDADGSQAAGTFVLDRTYGDGSVLEIASAPHPDAVAGAWDAVMDYGKLQQVLDSVGRPSEGAVGDDLYGMTALLASFGWTVDGITVQRVPQGQPTLVSWGARRTGSTTDEAPSILSVRVWGQSSWSAGEDGINDGSVISRCDEASCADAATKATTCEEGAICWSESSALVIKPIDDVEAGSWVLYRSSTTSKLALEIVVGPENCPEVCPATSWPAFLSDAQTMQVTENVQAALLASPTPSPTPTPSSGDAVARVLQSLGHRVVSTFPGRTEPGATSEVYTVDVDLNADNPVNASLTVTRVPAGVEVGSERVALSGVAMNSCDERTCTPVTSVTYPCPSSSCFQDWWAITTPAYTGLDQGTLLVFRSNGSQAVELVVGVPSCATCGTGPTGKAFLSLEDAQRVLNAIGFSLGGPTASATTVAACTPDEVKLIPVVGTPSEVTGGRGLWIEIHARNPQVDCLATAPASVSFEAADGSALSFLLNAGIYQGSGAGLDAGLASREITQSSGPARFALSKYRCDLPGFTAAVMAYVTLEGWAAPVAVQLPDGSGIERCVGDEQAAGNTVWVSGLDGGAG